MKQSILLLFVGLTTATIWSACSTPEAVDPNATLKEQVVANYCDIVYASYSDSHTKALELQTAINSLVATPTQVTFDAAKLAWEEALNVYSQTEVYRYADGPIDTDGGPEPKINGWPMDENLIDYTLDNAGAIVNTGIINDPVAYPNITATILGDLNEQGGEANITVGYHAIEFLLWGQDYNDVNFNVGQGGNRSYTDYSNSATNYDRRGLYIKACAELLVDELAGLKATWAPGGTYRTFFTGLNTNEAITKLLTGVGIMSKSELAGERMFTALETNSADNPQEDELCCFSDKTHLSIINISKGITNILTGVYTNLSGAYIGNTSHSILALLGNISASKSAELTTLNATAHAKINAMPIPFDKTVTEENVADNGPTLQAVEALQEQGDKIAVAAVILGIEISTALPQ